MACNRENYLRTRSTLNRAATFSKYHSFHDKNGNSLTKGKKFQNDLKNIRFDVDLFNGEKFFLHPCFVIAVSWFVQLFQCYRITHTTLHLMDREANASFKGKKIFRKTFLLKTHKVYGTHHRHMPCRHQTRFCPMYQDGNQKRLFCSLRERFTLKVLTVNNDEEADYLFDGKRYFVLPGSLPTTHSIRLCMQYFFRFWRENRS